VFSCVIGGMIDSTRGGVEKFMDADVDSVSRVWRDIV
jgi:hypothetical protein